GRARRDAARAYSTRGAADADSRLLTCRVLGAAPGSVRDAERVLPAGGEQQVIGEVERVLAELRLLILAQRSDEALVRARDRVEHVARERHAGHRLEGLRHQLAAEQRTHHLVLDHTLRLLNGSVELLALLRVELDLGRE